MQRELPAAARLRQCQWNDPSQKQRTQTEMPTLAWNRRGRLAGSMSLCRPSVFFVCFFPPKEMATIYKEYIQRTHISWKQSSFCTVEKRQTFHYQKIKESNQNRKSSFLHWLWWNKGQLLKKKKKIQLAWTTSPISINLPQ